MVGILSKSASPSSTLPIGVHPSTNTKGKFGDHHLSSSLPPATVPLHLLTNQENADRLYGNFASENEGENCSSSWKYDGLVCRIWEKQESGMVPLRRIHSPKLNAHAFFANNEDIDSWVKKEQGREEFIVGYVYRRDCPCPEGAAPLYGVFERRIGRLLVLSESERDSFLKLDARNLGIVCYVAPP